MANLGDLKQRIIDETNRSDLATGEALAGANDRAIDRAIEYYADEKFWFNVYQGTTTTTASQDYIDLPSGVRRIETITIPAYYTTLREVTIGTFYKLTLSSVDSSIPRYWAEYDEDIKLYPTPDAAYTLQITGIADIGTPGDDASENDWTTYGYDLISARARFTLLRDQFRDPEGASIAGSAERDAYMRLKRDTAKKLSYPRRSNIPTNRRFDINIGDYY